MSCDFRRPPMGSPLHVLYHYVMSWARFFLHRPPPRHPLISDKSPVIIPYMGCCRCGYPKPERGLFCLRTPSCHSRFPMGGPVNLIGCSRLARGNPVYRCLTAMLWLCSLLQGCSAELVFSVCVQYFHFVTQLILLVSLSLCSILWPFLLLVDKSTTM